MIQHTKTTITEKDIFRVTKLLKTGMIYKGKMVDKFENRIAKYIGKKYGFSTCSGTAALYLSLIALNVKSGDEVITSSYLCHNVISAILLSGATPRLVDIKADDFNIDLDKLEQKISRKTKAIIVPHMFGLPAFIDKLKKIDVKVIEDCCQSIGAILDNKKVGSFGDISVYSFHALKMITTGTGGMILTDDSDLFRKLQSFNRPDYNQEEFMRYFPLVDLQAVLGISQVQQLGNFINKRREIAKVYNDQFNHLDVELPIIEDKRRKSVCYRYCIKMNKQRDLKKTVEMYLKEGIVVRRLYKPLHQFTPFKDQFCEISENVFNRTISIPIFPTLSEANVNEIIDKTRKILG